MKTPKDLLLDAIALVIYLAAANPLITGLAIHEWLSLGVLIVFLVHVISHFDTVAESLQRVQVNSSTANFALDILILIAFSVVTVSGLMVSRFILPFFDLVAPGYFFWNPLHSISAKILLALILIHVFSHWKWFVMLFRNRKFDEVQIAGSVGMHEEEINEKVNSKDKGDRL